MTTQYNTVQYNTETSMRTIQFRYYCTYKRNTKASMTQKSDKYIYKQFHDIYTQMGNITHIIKFFCSFIILNFLKK